MRNMGNLNHDDAQKAGWKILKELNCEVIGKAILEEDTLKIMKSTKRFKVAGGFIYNTSTEIHRSGRVSVAEALVFVPDVVSVSVSE